MAPARNKLLATEDSIAKLIGAVELLADSNKTLAASTEKEVNAIQAEYKDLRAIVETQARSSREDIKELTQSVSEMSQSLEKYALKSQHTAQETKNENTRLKTSIAENKQSVELIEGQLLIMHKENSDRDKETELLKKDVQNLTKTIEEGFSRIEKRVENKGKWWSDNWNKVITVIITMGSLIWALALAISNNGTTP